MVPSPWGQSDHIVSDPGREVYWLLVLYVENTDLIVKYFGKVPASKCAKWCIGPEIIVGQEKKKLRTEEEKKPAARFASF